MDYWYILVCNTEFFYLTYIRHRLLIHSRLQHRALLPHLATSSIIDTFSSVTPISSTSPGYLIDYWYVLVCNTELFYLTWLRHGLLIHSRLQHRALLPHLATSSNHCYMISSVTPSVLLLLPISRTIVTWHRLLYRVFSCICLYQEPLVHDIFWNNECSTLPAYITDHCYVASSATPSVLLYLPISRTIVTCHCL